MSEHSIDLTIRVHEEDDGSYWADVVEMPGCFASGMTLDELREAMAEAISLYLHDDPDAGHISEMQPLGEADVKPMRIGEMRVTVPA